jgi:hypothetical protein
MDERLRSRKVAHLPTHETRHNRRQPQRRGIPSTDAELRRTHGFPDVLRISRDVPICGIITSRPQRSRTFLNPTQRPPTADQQPCPPSPPTAGTGRPGTAGLILPPAAQDQRAEAVFAPTAPEPAQIVVVLVRAGSARHRNPLVAGGHQRSRPADHRAGRHGGRPSKEPAAGKATVGPTRLNWAIISVHHSVLASWRSTTREASPDREIPTR